MTRKHAIAFLALLLMTGCSSGLFSDKNDQPPLEGERISILELQQALEPDNALLETQGLIAPPPWKNAFWPQSGGYPNHSMQHLALNEGALSKIWSTSIGAGTTDELPLTAQPILVDGVIYTLDARARLTAFQTENGKEIWSKYVGNEEEDDPVITGGLAYSSGVVYVTNGFNEVLALRADNGEHLWRKTLTAPARAAPTVLDGRLFVATLDHKLLAIHAGNGSILWEYLGIGETAGLVGAANPAANRDIVVPVFSSGEISALRVANGSLAWSDNLSNLRGLGGLSTISDIKALPVIDKGIIIALSFSGRMVAIDERTGQRIWQREISGSQTPWVAGNHVFVLSTDNKLVALGRDTGSIRWVTSLPRFDKSKPITFTGPILAGGRLIVAGSDGLIIEITPETGEILRQWDAKDTIAISPIVANGTLYLLSENGKLSAYR